MSAVNIEWWISYSPVGRSPAQPHGDALLDDTYLLAEAPAARRQTELMARYRVQRPEREQPPDGPLRHRVRHVVLVHEPSLRPQVYIFGHRVRRFQSLMVSSSCGLSSMSCLRS